VAGGDDFKIYKFDFQEGTELGKHLATLPSREGRLYKSTGLAWGLGKRDYIDP